MNLQDKITAAAEYVLSKISLRPTIALVLGSGLGDYADTLEQRVKIPYSEIPNFPQPTVEGHTGAFVFGVIYSVSLTPCVGAFLGSALMMASASGTALKGVLLLLTYSAGLGIPFLLSALLLGQLTGTFNFIKRHYKIINLICGIFLVIVGVMMIFGLMNRLMAIFS